MITYLLGCIFTAAFYTAYTFTDNTSWSLSDTVIFTVTLIGITILWPIYWGIAMAIVAIDTGY